MTDLNCKSLTRILKSDFGSLWHCTQRGKTLEIITPYLYPDHSFVSIFVTKRGNRFIVSDAGHISEFFQSAKEDEPFFSSLISRARFAHSVAEFKQGDRTFYFKDTQDAKLVSSIAFDVANFLVAASNAAYLSISEDDAVDKNSFRLRADTFIRSQITRRSGKDVQFNKRLPEVKEATFSAIITSNSHLWVVLYLTGSSLTYFQLSVSNAIVNTEFLKKSSVYANVRAIVPLLNDDAVGYQPAKLTQRLGRLSEISKSKVVPWRSKDDIISLLS